MPPPLEPVYETVSDTATSERFQLQTNDAYQVPKLERKTYKDAGSIATVECEAYDVFNILEIEDRDCNKHQ